MRILIAGIVGGVLLFVWGAISHMLLPLGEAGFGPMPLEREPAVIEAMKSAMNERKVYFFPGADMNDPKAMENPEYKAKQARGPTGIVVFNPGAGLEMGAKPLLTEFTFNLLEGLIAAFIVAHLAASTSYGMRVLIVALIGISGAISIDGSYWNWYMFPDAYFAAQFAMAASGALIAGLAIAKLARPAS